MKKSIITVIVTVAILIVVGLIYSAQTKKTNGPEQEPITQNEEIDTSDWQTYRNEEFGFDVKIPQGWETKFQLGEGPGEQTGFWFLSFSDNKTEMFEGVPIGIFLNLGISHRPGESIESYADNVLNQYPFKVIESRDTRVDTYFAIQKIANYSKITEEDVQKDNNLAALVDKKYIATFWKNEQTGRTMSLAMGYSDEKETDLLRLYGGIISTLHFF